MTTSLIDPAVVAIDPVCGMKVDPAKAAATIEFEGESFYFCGKGCAAKFSADPMKYLQPKPAPEAPIQAAPGMKYTCPMDPEIVRDQPGACPKCGMALEPMTVTLDEANPELESMTRRFWTGVALTLPLLAIMVSELMPGQPLQHLLGGGLGWFEFAIATPVVLWGGWPFFQRGWASIVNRSLNMFTLIAIGSGAAYLYSVVAVAAPGAVPASFRMPDGKVGLYFEAAAVITVLVLLGQVLELRARSQTGSAIKALLGLTPKTARRVATDGSEHDVDLAEVHVGDRLRVRPGERVPTDGVVVDGASSVDESMVSGEPISVEKEKDAKVIGGTINGTGTFTMRTERVGSDTLLAQIVKMVSEAQRTRAPIQRLADRVAGYFVPAVLLAAVATFVAWAFYGPAPQYAHALVNAVAVLIIACPCALGLATPMAIMVGTGRGAHEGILFRNAEALETMEKVDTLVVDKTGTLTEGKPKVTVVVAAEGFEETEVLRLAASLEKASEHPLAAAVIAAARDRGLEMAAVEAFQSATGTGISGMVQGRGVTVANAAGIVKSGTSVEGLRDRAEALQREGQTVMYVAVDSTLAGLIAVADPIKATTEEALAQLLSKGIKVIMVTGDNRITAAAVAGRLGIDFEADVLPQQKADLVKRLQAEGRIVAMAGDGVNDAPALAQANVGVAMGTGTDVAMEAGGITLVRGDLRGVAKAHELSQATMRNIRQNLFFAFFYNAIGVPIAGGVLFPFFGVLLSPMISAAAMSFSSVSVIANSLRLRSTRI
ncbi:Cu+-exporting ATPase [Granulicella aggregans]|uniref:Cu+-exporting ATPase n=1 Tax=Granulicella aggregans TaxID=474949 RepID=A0A7W7ZA80_9BACT|nr:heavy metal translocating P-type ATPase [Granulicella aggregans]MBB5056022.1 Cu+-exporting ATPase [Granulicella aggregans]